MRPNLCLGSRRDEELLDEVPVLAVLVETSQKVRMLFLCPPSLVGPFPSQRWDQTSTRKRKEREKTTQL